MGVEIWIEYSNHSEEYFIVDFKTASGAGPITISNELYERIMEADREHSAVQSILEMLDYEWTYPEEDVKDCD